MFRSITKAFKAIDNFLTLCEEYTEQRVWNGKFLIDLRILSLSTFDDMSEAIKKSLTRMLSSHAYADMRSFLQKLAGLFMQFKVVADIVHLIQDGVLLFIKNFAHYLIVLVISLYLTYVLLVTLINNPTQFVVLLLPILFVNHVVFACFLNLVERKGLGSQASFAETLLKLKQTLPTTTFIFLIQVSLFFVSLVFYVGFVFSLSALFTSINIAWQSSFFYWLFAIMMGLALLALLYVFEVILLFAYAFIQDKKTTFQALQQSSTAIQHTPRFSLFFYFLLTIFSGTGIFFLSSTNYEGGFMVGTLFTSHAFLLLGFLLRRNYFRKDILDQGIPSIKTSLWANLLLGIGLLSYIGIAVLFVRIQPEIVQYIEEQHPRKTTNDYITYKNTHGYTINYPKSWSVYRWTDTSTTFYTNDTRSTLGGVKVVVDVMPVESSQYLLLHEANPGLITYDTGTQNVTIKIANVAVKGNNAVKYTYTKTNTTKHEYQTHYLIQNGEIIYDIALITSTKKSEAASMELFETMVKSFTISQE